MASLGFTDENSLSASSARRGTNTESSGDKKCALMILSFGGPEHHDHVRPFLENVTRGRGIPPERLDEVEVHYHHLGGVSPLNALNREIINNVEEELSARGRDLPVYFGNRNWHPFIEETVEEMVGDGITHVYVFATSAWGGSSGCRQYDEDIERALNHLERKDLPRLTMVKLRQFFDHPGFINPSVESVKRAFSQFSREDTPRLVFTGHSIPTAADEHSGVPADGTLYSNQIRATCAIIAERLGIPNYDLVWQSRSGSPHTPWLEPDIVDHARDLHERGINDLVVYPVGFISDHTEVVWDLDNELKVAADEWGMTIVRAATVGPTPDFTAMIVDLIEEYEAGKAPLRIKGPITVALRGCSLNGAPCAEGCCVSARPMHGNGHGSSKHGHTAHAHEAEGHR
ncbi:ferrochelatase [Corynebacterium glucuronolyticum]|uniref:Coproporphyrin III ferrochelatase n=2 Tax=Corynebacterium glucuronolyticum TaxID=39791 RepID=A0A7T4EE61_9CORY|nr:ferrochelatase [Corynebacterium glucuronolyticum]QQB45727.1 ferrochelatase [Corynebacterium glucuronolyticum]QRO83236.1 ferrochelatase [Corynebacterium glucuronolyticum]WKD63590.1 Ferrochelatase [Corynebacterium glucuronolyticum DSM 44120]SMB81143.1 ferrochelatase [Corynebacterium glucuronolyticum]